MTDLKSVMNTMIPLIPTDYKSDVMNDISFAEHGVIEMAHSLSKNFLIVDENGTPVTTVGRDEQNPIDYFIMPVLEPSEIYLASYYAYRTYLMNLKDSFNRDAINFKTLTFEIKSLEKRPEAINDSLYSLNRYLDGVVSKTNGNTSIVGKVSRFGGGTSDM